MAYYINEPRYILAMKGPPFTRKSEYAMFIAYSLQCPYLSLDDFLEVLSPECLQTCPSSNTGAPASLQPQDLAFQIICGITFSHLVYGISNSVVIDSPLSSRSHLDQLIRMASSIGGIRIVIVECKPEDKYAWESHYQHSERTYADETKEWYKPKNWNDVEKLILDLEEDYDQTSDGYKISKLVLDPFSDAQCYHFKLADINELEPLEPPPPLLEAVEYMMTRRVDDATDYVVHFDKWEESRQRGKTKYTEEDKYDESGSGQSSDIQQVDCKDGHSITTYTEARLGYEVYCRSCGDQVISEAYSCNNCSLVLHKDCAESFDTGYIEIWDKPFACASCTEDGESFSEECLSCLFETHLRLWQMPTIIRHECEKHFLCIALLPPHNPLRSYHCAACGGLARFVMYFCKTCNVAYHYGCLQRPAQVEHEHNGRHHLMQLEFSSEEAEDYLCDECLVKGGSFRRDPTCWFYSCEECVYEAHLDCID